ncbi:MAG: carboxypeptidase-like regulatory domain-containing protein, partial [Methylotetracoccus sp.]|nr:carboxypeptidase-like regulatory domain-containing protein [Methylotetracoccus sp.]
MSSRVLAVLASCLLLQGVPAFTQTTAGQITGIVSDPTGAPVPGATVVAKNQATGVTRRTNSNESGNYSVPLLEPGTYSVTVQKDGFRAAERAGVTLSVNSTARLDFSLTLGAVSESVSVTADVPLLQTGESSLRAVVDNRKVVELPLNGRNPFDLIFLAPGTQAYRRTALPGNNIPLSNLSINGGPSMTNEVLLDGIPSTSPQYNQFTVIPSIDAVQEFEVKTNNMAAEFGRTGGGVVNVAMKSGSNEIHGTLYDFLRNDALDSNLWLNNRTGQPKPAFRFNQFGASVGGPIKKDRTFYFGNYEGLRRKTGRAFLFSVPTELQRAGDFSQTRAQNGQLINIYDPLAVSPAGTGSVRALFPGNVIPANRFNTVSRNVLPFWTKPNLAGDPVTGINNFVSNKP